MKASESQKYTMAQYQIRYEEFSQIFKKIIRKDKKRKVQKCNSQSTT